MRHKASPPKLELPEFPYGSVWLVGAGDGDPRHLSPLAVHALGTADAVIHDLAVPRELLDLVKPSHYREAGSPYWAIGRAIHVAQDGWRVVHLVAGSTIEPSNAPPAVRRRKFLFASCLVQARLLVARSRSGFCS
jgi:hypothetical protein